MANKAEVVADSISPRGDRLLTCELTYWRGIHSEAMTHRVGSRNSASTRAIPLAVQLRNLMENPFIPERFGVNEPGMQSYAFLEGLKHDEAVKVWLRGRDRAVTTAIELLIGDAEAGRLLDYKPGEQYVPGDVLLAGLEEVLALVPKSTDQIDLSETSMLNVHKQLAGRGLEAYMWHTMVYTATENDNLFALRDHPEAQGEIRAIVHLMRLAIDESTPTELNFGEWHLPYVNPGEFDNVFDGIRSSGARTAATSYNRQHNRNPESEFKRYDDLVTKVHMSPLEHQATPFSGAEADIRKQAGEYADSLIAAADPSEFLVPGFTLQESIQFQGNFRGWTQHRKQIPFESNFALALAAAAA